MYKLARDRDEDGHDMKGRAVIKDGGGRLMTESGAVLEWEGYFRELLNREWTNGEPEPP